MTERDTCIFQRVEDKYRITKEQMRIFTEACGEHLKEDEYFKYTVHSIYYDSEDCEFAVHGLLKPNFKMKLRMRGYNTVHDDSMVFLETKKKYGDIVYKKRIGLRADESADYMEYGIPHPVQNNTASEIDYMMHRWNPEAKVMISYDRTSYAGTTEADVRITFDENIRYRLHDLDMRIKSEEIPLLGKDEVMLEIKVMDRYPMWLVRILSEMKLYKGSFSKYGTIYTENYRTLAPRKFAPAAGIQEDRLVCSVQY